MKPIRIEVVTHVLTVLSHAHTSRVFLNEAGVEEALNRQDFDEYPREFKEEFLKLSDWMAELGRLYRHRIRVNIIDAKSITGIWKSLRHRFRKYPAFIVDRKDVVSGWDRQRLSDVLDAHIQAFKLVS